MVNYALSVFLVSAMGPAETEELVIAMMFAVGFIFVIAIGLCFGHSDRN